jgi:2,4-dienoyl-CoA reductase (NADPH2)
MVPRASFTWVTRRLKGEVSIPLVTSNRINMPQTAERVLAAGDADMISMARPFLADPDWVLKAEQQREDEINTCIACNQACLDHVFQKKRASCLVNPQACYETEWKIHPVKTRRKIAVVGAGPAGLSFATTAAGRGHDVTLYEASETVGGQFNMAKRVPGKEEFVETLRYFTKQIELTGVDLRLGCHVSTQDLVAEDFDIVVLATGVNPRQLTLPGVDHAMVLSYVDVLRGNAPVGDRVAIIGAGGIGFDVAEFLSHPNPDAPLDVDEFYEEWGIDPTLTHRGGLRPAQPTESARDITICQRSTHKPGAKLGKTTGWIHRAAMKHKGVKTLAGCSYERIDDQGLHIARDGESQVLEVDNVIVCAGQIPRRELEEPLRAAGLEVHRIGGADVAAELDAKRAIEQGARLASEL